MSYDAIAISAIAAELKSTVLGGRVQKVVLADEVTFGVELYSQHVRRWLLFSADPQSARVHLVGDKVGRGSELVSPLLLLLRKYLRRARLLEVAQPDFERTLSLTFGRERLAVEADEDAPDTEESGEAEGEETVSGPRVTVVVEAIGRYSNVILVDAEGVVLDCARRVPAEINRYRVILPRHPYVPPPPQEKRPVEEVSAEDLSARLAGASGAAWQVLVGGYAGVSPQLAREAVYRATGRANAAAGEVTDPAVLARHLQKLLAPRTTGDWQPSVALKDGQVVAFAPYLLTQHPGVKPMPSISAAVDAFFSQRERFRPVDQAREAALRSLATRREAAARKLESLERALEGGYRAERYRLSGDAILARLPNLRRGQTDLLADGLEIALDPGLTPVDNAQAYFKRYRKAKAALAGVPALLEETRLYLDYLDQAAAHLNLAETPDQVRAIQRELSGRDAGPARGRQPKPGRQVRGGKPRREGRTVGRATLAGVARYQTPSGLEILVGRSGRLNDMVTFEQAGPEDVWLHARGVPGAHVIVRCGPGPVADEVVEQAAQLAAHFSASRGATSVPVDWTRRKLVKRIREALPGLVSYSGERTLQVRPEVPAALTRLA